MAAFLDVCRFLPTAGGTTDWTYSSAIGGYQSPTAAGVVNGRAYKYRAESSDLTQWEIGEGTYNTGTGVLSRTTVLFNSSGTTSKISFSAAPNVAIVALKEDLISIEEANAFSSTQKAQARANLDVLKKNYLVNGAMMVSQENGTTSGAISTTLYYPVDQFGGAGSNAGTATIAQVASATAGGSPNRARFTVTSADASVGAGDYAFIQQIIEGDRIADLKFGTASAKTVVVQFGVKAPAGTYCVVLMNGAQNRSYVAEYVIAGGEANTDVVKSVTIAGDTSGTWATDTSAGIVVRWGLMAGSTFQLAAGSWSAGAFSGSSNQFNLMGTNSNVFELFDAGLYESVAPPFQAPDYAPELSLCKRYFYKGTPPARGLCASASAISRVGCQHPVPMRASPTLTVSGNVGVTDGAVAVAISTISTNYSDADKFEIDATVTPTTLTANRVAMLYTSSGSISISARM
ncbi:hypothetical protein [Bradyrhizobium diazoefficiens]|uniref:hypothetical protein n=1 Tax=Bradyrhizobium diazoefficiens TaxID=1355477 RepID=UPI001B5FC3D7|nr:hypothetical protein [Bradyrhizobium japonicum]